MDYNPINIAPKGQKQGDYYHHDDRPLRLLGDRVRLQADRRRRGGRAEEDRRRGRPSPTWSTRPTRTCSSNDDPLREPLRPGLRPLPVRQGPDRAGRASCSRTWTPGSSRTASRGRGSAGAFGILLEPVGQRRLPGLAVHRRPVGLARPQGRQGRPRPDRPGPGAKQRECLKFLADDDPQRQGVPVLARPAPPAGHRALDALGQRVVLLRRRASTSRSTSGSSASRRSSWASA